MVDENINIEKNAVLETKDLSVFYGDFEAVKSVSLKIKRHHITAIIGPSGCGKSTLLRVFNRMNEFISDVTLTGEVLFSGKNIYSADVDEVSLRRRVGMVFQKPNPFPKSIFNNVSWGPKINGYKGDMMEKVVASLKKAALFSEVEDKLEQNGLSLSGGQQQRLCIARTIAMEPDVILMDEPCSALDPLSTGAIEDLLFELKKKFTIVIVTHNMQQAARVSDYTAFMYQGELIEFDKTEKIFTNPNEKRTEDYIRGRFG